MTNEEYGWVVEYANRNIEQTIDQLDRFQPEATDDVRAAIAALREASDRLQELACYLNGPTQTVDPCESIEAGDENPHIKKEK